MLLNAVRQLVNDTFLVSFHSYSSCFSHRESRADFSGRVVAILDGDTIEVLHNRTTERNRLAGIDCPEKKQPYGQRAKQATSAMRFDQNLIVHRANMNRYRRTIGIVELTDRTNLNYELVRQDWCWWYWKYALEEIFLEVLETIARDAKKGLWVDPNPIPPWDGGSGDALLPTTISSVASQLP